MGLLRSARGRVLAAALATLVLSVSLTIGAGDAGAKARTCKPVTLDFTGSGPFTYPVKVLKGKVSCKVARSTLKHFMATGRQPKGWACFRGHGHDNWAAKCSSTSTPRKVVQASSPIAG